MARFAVLNGTTVANVIVADSLEIAESLVKATCIEVSINSDANIGDTYDSATQSFIKPVNE